MLTDRSERLNSTSCLLFSRRTGATLGKARPIENSVTGTSVFGSLLVNVRCGSFSSLLFVWFNDNERTDGGEVNYGNRCGVPRVSSSFIGGCRRELSLERSKVSHADE
jgi:hypothetical protein